MESKLRVGTGYDAHPLVDGRKLVLGGVEIPFSRGLDGWSDADVLTHAIIDALMGAAALGDKGMYFPPGDPEYRDIYSLDLLKMVKDRLTEDGWKVVNIDATVLAESPKLQDFIEPMCEKLSEALGVPLNRVNVKASSGNGLGFAGRGEGIAAHTVALLETA